MSSEEIELYRSSNGDKWLLVKEPVSNAMLIRHQPNRASGGRATIMTANVFLAEGHGPQHAALLRLLGREPGA